MSINFNVYKLNKQTKKIGIIILRCVQEMCRCDMGTHTLVVSIVVLV